MFFKIIEVAMAKLVRFETASDDVWFHLYNGKYRPLTEEGVVEESKTHSRMETGESTFQNL